MSAEANAARPLRSLRALAIIPARLESQRLPRKMLLRAAGRALFAHTAHNVIASRAFARVIVATDAAEIVEEARREGIEARLTRRDHTSGSDRAAEAWRSLASQGERFDVIVNVQGDEPELEPSDLEALVRVFDDAAIEAATLAAPISDPSEILLPSVVKVVCDAHGDALYFSRAPIPAAGHGALQSTPRDEALAGESSPRDASRSGGSTASETSRSTKSSPRENWRGEGVHRRHVGVYAFRPDALLAFCGLARGTLEAHESLEQLRWLEAGRKMRVVAASRAPIGIDTLHDFERFAVRAESAVRRAAGADGASKKSQVRAG